MATRVRFTVDVTHCQRAEEEIFAVLSAQSLAFEQRMRNSRIRNVLLLVLRWLGFGLSILGLVAMLAVVGLEQSLRMSGYAFIFAMLAAVFWFVPYFERAALAFTTRIRVSTCRRSAQRLTRIARRYAPFEADYDLKGSLLTYTRGKEGAWHAAWQRDLVKFRAPAVAIERPSVTLIFRRPRSLQPSIVILHDGSGWLGEVLREAKVEVTSGS